MDLIILIPTYNEEKTILNVVNSLQLILLKIQSKYPKIKKIFIYILDDCSTDNTIEKVILFLKKKKKNNRVLIKYKKSKINIGKSKLIFKELKKINKNNLVFITDGDIELSSTNIQFFLKNYFKKNVDLICGYRNLTLYNNKLLHYFVYSLGSKFSNFLVNFGYSNKIKDVHCGQKLFKPQNFSKFYCYRFSLDIELGLFFLRNSKKIYNLRLNRYKRRTAEQGKKLNFINGIYLIWQTIFIKIFS